MTLDDIILGVGIYYLWKHRAVLQPTQEGAAHHDFTPFFHPVNPDLPDEPSPVPSWSPDGKTLNSLSGFHRAKQSEVTSELVEAAKDVLMRHAMGQIILGRTLSGVRYAIAVEEHYHPPGGPLKPWGPHKGSSVFISNT